MLTIYIGKSASGKDTFFQKMIRLGIKPIISYTTRPKREKEIEGKDYFFISKREFSKKISNCEFLEYRSYETLVNGKKDVWWYGSPVVDVKNNDYVTVLDIDGAKSCIEAYGSENVDICYIDVDDEIRKERATIRGSFDETEWNRRCNDDKKVFSEENLKELASLLGRPYTRMFNNNPYKVTFSTISN